MAIISTKSNTVKREGNELVIVKKDYFEFLKRPELYIMLLATFIRIFLSLKLSIWYRTSDAYDDQLLINYADLSAHFFIPDIWSMVKTMSFPVFLNFVHLTGLSYSMVMAIIWIAAALLLVRVFKVITDDRFFLTFVYLFTLFTPAAFDNWVGTRLYRNGLIAPFVLIAFSLMLLIILKLVKNKKVSVKNIIFSNLILGFIFTFTYYLKEDGIWLLPCLILAIVVSSGIVTYRYFRYKNTKKAQKRIIPIIIVLFLPLLIFVCNTNVYKMINYHYFNVYQINTRTEGALGDFVNNIYKIQSEQRNTDIWAPKDAIEKAFEVSVTLKKYPELKEEILNSPWLVGGIDVTPIKGDFLTWVLRTALFDTGIWENEAQAENLFKQINSELEEAFSNNLLEKDPKIQITSSGAGRNIEEILQLTDIVKREYCSALFLKGYEPGGQLGEYNNQESYAFVTELLNENIIVAESDNTIVTDFKMANRLTEVIFKIYALLNPVSLIISIFSVIYISFQFLRKRYSQEKSAIYLCCSLTIVVLLGISCVYALAIGWFVEFLLSGAEFDWILLKFYSIGLVPILILVELLGAYLFFEILKGNDRLPSEKEKANISKSQIEKTKRGEPVKKQEINEKTVNSRNGVRIKEPKHKRRHD